MSTQIYDGTVQVAPNTLDGVDPRRRRYGYNPNIFQMQAEATDSGQQQRIIPAGLLIPFRTRTLKAENFDIGVKTEEYVKQVEKDFTAAWFIANVKMLYAEFGFREISCLTMLEDFERDGKGKIVPATFLKSPNGYFDAVHPAFADLGHQCPHNLSVCVTCRLFLLGAPDFENNPDGDVPEWLEPRIEKLPDPNLGEELRQALIEPNQVYEGHARFKWSLLLGEMEKRSKGEIGIAVLGEAEHHLRNNLHEIAPADRAAATAAGFGEEVGRAQAEGMKEMAQAFREGGKRDTSDELLARMIERQDKTDEVLASLAQTTQQLAEAVLTKKAE